MSTPLIILATILAIFALVLIPLMMVKGGRREQGIHSPDEARPVVHFNRQHLRGVVYCT